MTSIPIQRTPAEFLEAALDNIHAQRPLTNAEILSILDDMRQELDQLEVRVATLEASA